LDQETQPRVYKNKKKEGEKSSGPNDFKKKLNKKDVEDLAKSVCKEFSATVKEEDISPPEEATSADNTEPQITAEGADATAAKADAGVDKSDAKVVIGDEDGDDGDRGERRQVEVCVPQSEFVLGLADLTGEVMRQAINMVGIGETAACFTLLRFLHEMHAGFLQAKVASNFVHKETRMKIKTLEQSLKKVSI